MSESMKQENLEVAQSEQEPVVLKLQSMPDHLNKKKEEKCLN